MATRIATGFRVDRTKRHCRILHYWKTFNLIKKNRNSHRRRKGRGSGDWSPLKRKFRGSALRFGPENIGNAAENCFGKIFRLVIFFTNRFTTVTFGEILFSRTLWTAPSRFREANQLLPFFHLTLRQPVSHWHNGGLCVYGNPNKCKAKRSRLYSWFNQARLKPVSNLEKFLVSAANSDDFSEHLEELQRACFETDIDCGRLGHQLYLVHDAVKTTLPKVRQVTNIRTICKAFNKTPVTKTLLGMVHKLLRLYLTLPLASVTSERTPVFFPTSPKKLR